MLGRAGRRGPTDLREPAVAPARARLVCAREAACRRLLARGRARAMPGAPDDGMQAAEQRAKRSLAFEAGGAPSPSPAGAAASPRRTAAAVEATRSSPRPRRTPLRAPAAAGGSRAANNSANASPAKARGAGSLRASPARARAVPSALTLPASSVPSSPQAKMAAAARAAAAAAGIPMESLLAGSPARAKPPQRRYSRGGRADDEGTPQKKTCNCKNSRCLKLYCECFASGRYCDGCNCTNCFNNSTHESVRREAVEQTLERNPVCVRGRPLGEACALFCQGRACARLSVYQRRVDVPCVQGAGCNHRMRPGMPPCPLSPAVARNSQH